MLTDGQWCYQAKEEKTCAELKKNPDYLIYGIGIGGADLNFLNRISTNSGKMVDLSKLTEAFVEVADSIAKEVA